jgi:hypothetical protein
MKTHLPFHHGEETWRNVAFAITITMVAAVASLSGNIARAGGTVTSCTESSLRAAMAGGGTVTFACDGTIAVANTLTIALDTVLDASGHQVSISGGNALPVVRVNPNVAVSLINLTICNGKTPNGTNGTLLGMNGGPGDPGGGIYNAGTLTLLNCVATANRTGNGGYGNGYMGIYPLGGAGGPGGGIYNTGTLILSNTIVSGNATGVGGASGGYTWYPAGGDGGFGGGIYNNGVLLMESSTVCSNTTGVGPDNAMRGPGANGGTGGGIWSGGILAANGCTFNDNVTGHGGHGGVSDLNGGPGGAGGSGGAICNAGDSALTNCSFSRNSTGYGGSGGSGWLGYNGANGPAGSGAGVYNQSSLTLVNCTITTNRVGGGVNSANGSTWLLNTIVALNAGSAPDVAGPFLSLGHNLIGITNGSSGFTAQGDLAGCAASPIDPKLGSPADNGGSTLTVALLAISPAIDAGTTAGAPATDQRGIARPQGRGVDIGAYEFRYTIPQITGAGFQSASIFWLQCCGLPNQTYMVQTSTNLLNWCDAINVLADSNGVFEFVDSNHGDDSAKFYRLKSSIP